MWKVKDWMTREVFSLGRNDTLKDARAMMALARIRHVPVVDPDDTFVGLVTHRDLLTATISTFADVDKEVQDEIDSGIPVSELMRDNVTVVSPTTDLKHAARTLYANKYGCLPVCLNGKLVGIITEADFLRLAINLLDTMESV